MADRLKKWRIVHYPAEPGRVVSLSERWAADNYTETAVFGSREEAVEFAKQRWGTQFLEAPNRGRFGA